jgi:hypothetical protein
MAFDPTEQQLLGTGRQQELINPSTPETSTTTICSRDLGSSSFGKSE